MKAFFSSTGKILLRNFKTLRTTLLKWAIAGYLIRLILMPLFGNADQLTTAWISLTLVRNHQLILSNDPPLAFYVIGSFFSVVYPLLPTAVVNFLTSSNTGYTPALLLQLYSLYLPGTPFLLFISKIPYLIFDFATAILLLHFFDEEKKSLLAFKLWMINPFSVFISYVIGQYDIMAVFFLMLALYFFKRQKMQYSMLSLGIAGAFKMFSLLFALPLALIYVKGQARLMPKIKTVALLVSIALLPAILTILVSIPIPVYYESANAATANYGNGFEFNGFFGTTIYNRGNPGQPILAGLFFFFMNYSANVTTLTGFYDVIYFLPLVFGLFLLGVIYWQEWTLNRVWKTILIFLLFYYAVALFHMQWFLWAQPLLMLLLAEDLHKFLKLYLILVPLYFIYSLYWNPQVVSFMNNIGLPGIQVVNFFRAIFSGVCIFIALLVFKAEFLDKSNLFMNNKDWDKRSWIKSEMSRSCQIKALLDTLRIRGPLTDS